MSSMSFPILAVGSNSALVVFLFYTLAVFGLAALSNRLLKSKNFLSEYFLGSRSLGVWAFALTFAATSASGGSFTGFPAKIYSHGWILGLWIASYMVVPICTMGLIGKRINQVARISEAITVPDVLRDRYRSPYVGLLAVSLIVFFMSFNLVGQFKAGSKILVTLLQDVALFQDAVGWVAGAKESIGFLSSVDADYLLCLFTFAVAVIIYTTYGGFHAVVWTDVMQGVVMVFGVMIMLPLALWQVGGLNKATQDMAKMTTPRVGLAEFRIAIPVNENTSLNNVWFTLPNDDGDLPRLFRVSGSLTVAAASPDGETELPTTLVKDVKFVELTTPFEIERQLDRLRKPATVDRFNQQMTTLKTRQLAWVKASDIPDKPALISQLETELGLVQENYAALLTIKEIAGPQPQITLIKDYPYGADTPGVYVTGPGPVPAKLPKKGEEKNVEKEKKIDGFLPLSLAISFFFMWAISGTGQPSNMVRLMAFNSSTTLRRSMITVAVYYSAIYIPLVIIFCCARLILPGMELDPDRIMPQMAVTLSQNIGMAWLAGLLVAAPFAAIMSTVDSFLLMISSSLVRDIYQRNLNPKASERQLKRLSYLVTLLIGLGALLGAINPPKFLQDIIVYTGSGLAASFLGPMIFTLYWPRANTIGTIGGMLAGFSTHLAMYVAGKFVNGSFYEPYRLFNFNPILIGLFVSFAATYFITRWTPAPPEDLVRKYFCKRPSA